MAIPITTPRINNNDDVVRFSHILSPAGTAVKKGDPVAEIETDKATFTIEAEEAGYVLGFVSQVGQSIRVGSVLAWLGHTSDEAIPVNADTGEATEHLAEPTLKAAILLGKFGLTSGEVPRKGERLTAQDVLEFVQRQRPHAPVNLQHYQHTDGRPAIPPGNRIAVTTSQRAMHKSVLWHRQAAVPGYVEIEYDIQAWDEYAACFQREHSILLSPLLPLMACRLVGLAADHPQLNCTIVGEERHDYTAVNLGFTLQSDTRLSLLSVRDAEKLNELEFVQRLGALMRRGMKEKLSPEDTSDVTISFSSMAKWRITRHIPVLPPYTSLIVAHASARDGVAALGATYDHRTLTGGDVAAILNLLATPPALNRT